MAKVVGQNIPPELAKEFGHIVEADVDGVNKRRRRGDGGPTPGRSRVRSAFLKSTVCFNLQSEEQKQQWYIEAGGSGMRYYNYFMQQTLKKYLGGVTPPWCRELEKFDYRQHRKDEQKTYFTGYINPLVNVTRLIPRELGTWLTSEYFICDDYIFGSRYINSSVGYEIYKADLEGHIQWTFVAPEGFILEGPFMLDGQGQVLATLKNRENLHLYIICINVVEMWRTCICDRNNLVFCYIQKMVYRNVIFGDYVFQVDGETYSSGLFSLDELGGILFNKQREWSDNYEETTLVAVDTGIMYCFENRKVGGRWRKHVSAFSGITGNIIFHTCVESSDVDFSTCYGIIAVVGGCISCFAEYKDYDMKRVVLTRLSDTGGIIWKREISAGVPTMSFDKLNNELVVAQYQTSIAVAKRYDLDGDLLVERAIGGFLEDMVFTCNGSGCIFAYVDGDKHAVIVNLDTDLREIGRCVCGLVSDYELGALVVNDLDDEILMMGNPKSIIFSIAP